METHLSPSLLMALTVFGSSMMPVPSKTTLHPSNHDPISLHKLPFKHLAVTCWDTARAMGMFYWVM
jgi:hypothetical protein